MNPVADLLDDLRSASQQQWALRASILVSTLGFAFVLVLAGQSTPWSLVILGGLGFLCFLNPHSVIPGAVIVYCLAVWWAGVPDPFNPLALPAALCLLVVHTACALAAAVPPQADLPKALFGQYAVRLALVAGATTVVSLVGWTIVELQPPGGIVALLGGLLTLGVALGMHYWVVTVRPDGPDGR